MKALWGESSSAAWHGALDSYAGVVARQGVAKLAELDNWYRGLLPGLITGRKPPHLVLEELVRLTEWKMARGVWRARNLALVKGNAPAEVVEASAAAIAAVPHPTAPISALVKLAGVGPATASGVLAAHSPAIYPFFDELVAAQVPGLGAVAWTLGYYVRYAEALRNRAGQLSGGWTPAMVERALWAHAGGKLGA